MRPSALILGHVATAKLAETAWKGHIEGIEAMSDIDQLRALAKDWQSSARVVLNCISPRHPSSRDIGLRAQAGTLSECAATLVQLADAMEQPSIEAATSTRTASAWPPEWMTSPNGSTITGYTSGEVHRGKGWGDCER